MWRYALMAGVACATSALAQDAYDDAPANDSRRGGYGRNIGDRSYPQDGMQQRSWQQRWEETFGSVRIPGVRRASGSDAVACTARVRTCWGDAATEERKFSKPLTK